MADVPASPFIVGYAGTVGITNALEPFFRAAESMANSSNVHFLVLGEGGLLAEYQRRFSHLPNLTFIAKVQKEAVSSVLERCDLLYLSTFRSEVWRYGQSLNKLVDYMLAGKPVLASYSGFPSMIDEAGCGSFVPAEDVPALVAEIERYASMQPEERKRLGQRGREWVLNHRTFRSLAEAYDPILFPHVGSGSSQAWGMLP